jgi:hypothetical protein
MMAIVSRIATPLSSRTVMPSRLITIIIVLFWLATTGWLVYREVGPRFRQGEAPPFTIDLTDEVGAASVNWNVLQKGERIGGGFTQVRRKDHRIFEFTADFRVDRFKILLLTLEKAKMIGSYTVTEEGRLLRASAQLKTDLSVLGALIPVELDFQGEIQGSQMHPKLKILAYGQQVTPFSPEPFPVPESGRILNPMHLVHKISGLREGQTWAIPLMDPLRALPSVARDQVPGKDLIINQVQAEVKAEPLEWHGILTPCFKIEYRQPGEKPMAETWVRRRDSVVLRQAASYEGIEYTLERAAGQ